MGNVVLSDFDVFMFSDIMFTLLNIFKTNCSLVNPHPEPFCPTVTRVMGSSFFSKGNSSLSVQNLRVDNIIGDLSNKQWVNRYI